MRLQAYPITTEDGLQELQSFLASNKLPFEDICLPGNYFFKYADSSGKFIGTAGLETYGTDALLRSVAVDPSERGKNHGNEIVDDLVRRATAINIKSLFLLTETAHGFFLKKGFKDISRDQVPYTVKASAEFSFVCPATAKCMVYTIG